VRETVLPDDENDSHAVESRPHAREYVPLVGETCLLVFETELFTTEIISPPPGNRWLTIENSSSCHDDERAL